LRQLEARDALVAGDDISQAKDKEPLVPSMTSDRLRLPASFIASLMLLLVVAAALPSNLPGGSIARSSAPMTAAPAPERPALPPATNGRTSAVIALDAPGVLARWRAAGAPALGGDAASVAAAARSEAARLRAWMAEVDAALGPLERAVERAGGRVVGRYRVAAVGLRVHAASNVLSLLAEVPGVAFVEAGPQVRPLLSRSAPAVGAETVAGLMGWDGAGSVVAVIDTGIDYTHAALGGPGSAAAYAAAAAGAERIDDDWQGTRLFPNERVIGGYDFAGPNYTSPAHCPPEEERRGRCTSTPHPDDDPLDAHGHGTHVSAIAAGAGGGGVAPGVAPGARLVALKLYGPPSGGLFADESVDGLIDAIEWLAAANLGLETRGVVPEHVDVANISLGEPWAQGSRLFDAAVEAATDAGVTIVASAGNDRDVPFILGAPGSSPRVLSVAGTSSPAAEPAMRVSLAQRNFLLPVFELLGAPRLDVVGRIGGAAVAVGTGCPGATLAASPEGAVAVVEPGACPADVAVAAVEAAGARAVLLLDVVEPSLLGVDPTQRAIPVLGLRPVHAALLRDAMVREAGAGGADPGVGLELDGGLRVTDPATGTSLAGFSSRGPARSGALKPDLAAPGASIASAAMGSGAGAKRLSGTSMSAPHVAGAAAILRQASRERGDSLGAIDLAALMMTRARPDLEVGVLPAPVARQGAGRLDLVRAVGAPLLVRAGAVASLDLGAPALPEARTVSRTVQVTNLSGEARSILLRARPRDPGAAGLRVLPPTEPVTIAAGSSISLAVGFAFDPASLPPWPYRDADPTFTIDPADLDRLERDGWLEIFDARALVTAEEDPSAPRPAPLAGLPYRALPRAASAVRLSWSPGLLQSTNDGAAAGQVMLFDVHEADAAEPALRHELDLARFGARLTRRAEGAGTPDTLELAFVRHETAALPHTTVLAAFLDLDQDGRIDWRVAAGPEAAITGSGSERRMGVAAVRWDAEADAPAENPRAIARWPATLHGRVATFAVPLATFGMESAPTKLALYGAAYGLDETWWGAPNVDWVPDASIEDGNLDAGDEASGPPLPEDWLRLEASATRALPVLGERPPGDRSVELVRAVCRSSAPDGLGTVLALLPDNPADPLGGAPGQVAVLTGADTRLSGAPVPELPLALRLPCRAWLPWGFAPAR
jgi:subtilisin family serine protease